MINNNIQNTIEYIDNFIETSYKDNAYLNVYIRVDGFDSSNTFRGGEIYIDENKNINIVRTAMFYKFMSGTSLIYDLITPLKTLPRCYSELIKNKIAEVHKQYEIKTFEIPDILFEPQTIAFNIILTIK